MQCITVKFWNRKKCLTDIDKTLLLHESDHQKTHKLRDCHVDGNPFFNGMYIILNKELYLQEDKYMTLTRKLSVMIMCLILLLSNVNKINAAVYDGLAENASVSYSTHVQKIGWQDTVSDGEMSGTSGQSLRLEGIRINVESSYSGSVQYKTHVQKIGWQDWVSDGEMAGTSGQSLRLEEIRIKLVSKGSSAPGTTSGVFYKA